MPMCQRPSSARCIAGILLLGALSLALYQIITLLGNADFASQLKSADVLRELLLKELQSTFLTPNSGRTSADDKENSSKQQYQQRKRPDYHVVFSTSCSPLQDWQSMVFYYHAMKVKQPGNVTRIASGCSATEAQKLEQFHNDFIKPMSDRFHLHLTPDFSTVRLESGKHPYKYMNKPYGLRHWMENRLGLRENMTEAPSSILDGIVMLLDPDMVLLRPLLHNFSNEEVLWVEKSPKTKVVRHGYPIAQQDGYLANDWMRFNFSYVTSKPEGEYIKPRSEDGPLHWNSGPPYLATVKDMYRIAVRWTEYAPLVLDIYPELFAEMYGLVIATVQLELPFTFIKSIVVSETSSGDREGWQYVDALPEDQVCSDSPISKPLPIGLHYCQRYSLGKWFFVKYRVKKNIMKCEQALISVPPKDVFPKYDYNVLPARADLSDNTTWKEKRDPVRPKIAKREAFMLCRMVAAVNEAVRHHKSMACSDGTANLNETWSVYEDPSDW